MISSLVDDAHFNEDLDEFKYRLNRNGVEGALGFLSSRTPHRFTGIYQFGGSTLLNLALFDSTKNSLIDREDSPIEATYCSLVKDEEQQMLEINDAAQDERVKGKVITPVISYCGVLIRDAAGEPFGTLCHFDMLRCQERVYDLPLLQAASALLYQHLQSEGLIRTV